MLMKPYANTPMSTLTIELLSPKAKTILDGLEDAGLIAVGEAPRQRKTHSVMELKGLGAELWKADTLPNLGCDAPLEEFEGYHDFEELAPLADRVPKWNCMKGEAWMADDFNAPMEEFAEYM